MRVTIIGAGLAGSEAALFLAKSGIDVDLIEMKSIKRTPAQSSDYLGELVCSNSLKSVDETTASGLLKKELELLDCNLLRIARENAVPAGGALAVNRENFAKQITKEIKNHKNINLIEKVVSKLDFDGPTILATGPLTDGKLMVELSEIIGDENLFFYDAIAPIVEKDSIDFDKAFMGNRYDKGGAEGDYINCLLSKDEFQIFHDELIGAKCVELKEFEKLVVFEACMPIEEIAKRGFHALRFGPMKPVGLFDEKEGRTPYAVLQLRKENIEGSTYNLVGFQTNLLYGEQKRVFSLIPALKNAEYVRYGVMHRNSYLCAPKVLNLNFSLKAKPNIYVAGQLSGVEGYVESIACGLYCAINILSQIKENKDIVFSSKTCLGGIFNAVANGRIKNFQPQNANFGIITIENNDIKNKIEKRQEILKKSLIEIGEIAEVINKLKY